MSLADRTVEKALDLAQQFSQIGQISAMGLDGLSGLKFDVVINGTSSSMQNARLPIEDNIFSEGALAYDMFYAKELTPFLQLAQSFGVRCVADGLGMLVEQAAQSYYLWNGFMPQTEPVIRYLRSLLERS